jgi:hypothetical protein
MLTRRALAGGLAALAVVGLLAGCGGSSGGSTVSRASAPELRAAQIRGEEAAKERDRVAGLQRQVRSIRRRLRHHDARHEPASSAAVATGGSTPQAAAPVVSEGPVRSFHAPSGNVSCEVLTDGATCTVASVGLTFVLESGSAARVEAGAALPSGLGELMDYGSTVSAGSITCEVPPSDVPRGITCVDLSDGHGFEASRDSSRQKAY